MFTACVADIQDNVKWLSECQNDCLPLISANLCINLKNIK